MMMAGREAEQRRRRRGSASAHRVLKDKAKNRVDDLHGVFTDLQLARKESRTGDLVVLEEQVHQMLREWKSELYDSPSPSSSSHLHGGNTQAPSVPSSEIMRLLQLYEEEDDATSKLSELPALHPKVEPTAVPEPDIHITPAGGDPVASGHATAVLYHEDNYVTNEVQDQDHGFMGVEQYQSSHQMGLHDVMNCIDESANLAYQPYNLHQDSTHNVFQTYDTAVNSGGDVAPNIAEYIQAICPPPAAFFGPKCALWDCPRPAQGSGWYQDYCSSFHATLALNEGPPGRAPVLRPGGIDLKDGPLFAALAAKTQGKNVGIPECEGAATSKSPWNAPELFDLLVFEGETLREWLFFDKPRRAFESGNRKQRSLPDYSGRGWHESRKQVMKEVGGLKRSYYMDPQPQTYLEWHLFEYEISDCDICALYRLELKLVDPKKNVKGKVTNDSLVDLQKQMGRLNAASPMDNKGNIKGRVKSNQKEAVEGGSSVFDVAYQKDNATTIYSSEDQAASVIDKYVHGPRLPYEYEGSNDYYGPHQKSEYYGT